MPYSSTVGSDKILGTNIVSEQILQNENLFDRTQTHCES